MAILVDLVSCTPFAYNWDSTIPGGHCANQNDIYVAVGAFDLVIDVLVFALPQSTLWKLQVSRAKKIALYCIFGLGGV